ncbi:hypothetical protein OIU78_015038 [Salix suchowensis]|nr:hypothetical protein OIU78_015038 [Salix suchowensis]
MATISDIGVAAAINILTAFAFFIVFAILRIQPVNDRVYFPKWYIKGLRSSPLGTGAFVGKFVNLDFRSYVRFLNWMPAALQMPEPELIDHAGLDSAVYLRIYLTGLKIFVPIAFLAFTISVPVNWTNNTLELSNLTYSDLDKLSISNIPTGSCRFWTHLKTDVLINLQYWLEMCHQILMNQLVNSWNIFSMVNHPSDYLTQQVVYNANVLSQLVNKKKKMKNWLDYYQIKYSRNQARKPSLKTGFLGLWGNRVDAIDHYTSEIERLSREISLERDKIVNNPKSIMPAAFVSFKTRWGAAVCAQTQQSRNPTIWLTGWAPEPRDVYWDNLAIPFVSLALRRLVIAVAFFFLTFFFMIPIAFVQSLANIEGIEKALPFLKPIIEMKVIKSFIQGFLPGIALKIFLIFLPSILMLMSKFEGFISLSGLERRSAARYYIFQFINVFLGSIITGTAFQQLDNFIHQSATQIPKTVGVSIPMKATFFITYIMVDGWAGVAGEILRLKPLIIFHLKNFFMVKTEKDREEAMDPGTLGFNTGEPQIQLYFLLGLVYAVVSPILLPFIIVFFALAYVVYRHQIINVYNQEYESAAAFWPDSTPLLITLPILTIWFHLFCKGRYEPAFVRYPLQEAMMKDTLERAREPNLNLKSFLQDAYRHPVFKGKDDSDSDEAPEEFEKEPGLVPTKRQSRRNTPLPSKQAGSGFVPPSVKLRIILYFETVSATSTCVNASPWEIELIDIVQHRGCTDRPRKEIVSSAKEHSTEIGTYSC